MAKTETRAPLPQPRTEPEPVKDARDTVPKIAVSLTSDGKAIAWDRMRPSTQEQLRALVANDPKLGQAQTAGAAAAEVLPDEWCAAIIDMVGQVEMLLAMRTVHATADQARVMLYSADERAALVPPVKRVLNKHLSAAVLKYGDELALFVMMGGMTAQKLTALKANMATPVGSGSTSNVNRENEQI